MADIYYKLDKNTREELVAVYKEKLEQPTPSEDVNLSSLVLLYKILAVLYQGENKDTKSKLYQKVYSVRAETPDGWLFLS